MTRRRGRALLLSLAAAAACASAPAMPAPPASAAPPAPPRADAAVAPIPAFTRDALAGVRQLVLVRTATYDTIAGALRRYERDADGAAWRPVSASVPVVVGRAGLAWDDALEVPAGAPVKREGDGRAPAGLFPIDTVFGFASAGEMGWVRPPYVTLTPGSECVDDTTSSHYNTIVDRATVSRVDWNSSEKMRQIGQYKLGATVRYNSPPRAGRGSCIFLHIWGGPGIPTDGCTAMAEHDLTELVLWMDPARHPALLQLPEAEYARLRDRWRLP